MASKNIWKKFSLYFVDIWQYVIIIIIMIVSAIFIL